MGLHYVQILQYKKLNGIELTDSEERYLEKYEQSKNDVFDNWLANNR